MRVMVEAVDPAQARAAADRLVAALRAVTDAHGCLNGRSGTGVGVRPTTSPKLVRPARPLRVPRSLDSRF